MIKWAALSIYLVMALGFAKNMNQQVVCSQKQIVITGNNKFIETEDVNNLLINNGLICDSIPMRNINFDYIEKLIKTHPAVAKVQTYSDYEGKLIIVIKQRTPILRVVPKDLSQANGYYIDAEGEIMPLSKKHTAHVTVLTGEITPEFTKSLHKDSITVEHVKSLYGYTLLDVFEFSKFIATHELWGPQFDQIHINSEYDIELIPRVGNHIILLGDLENYRYKLSKLEAMYREGFKKADWNKYTIINLKYSNQVVCTK